MPWASAAARRPSRAAWPRSSWRARGSRWSAREAAELLDIGIYRVVPDGLREAILRRGRGPLAGIAGQSDAERAAVVQLAALERLASASTVTDSPPTAKMIHSMLTHPPAVLQADCSTGERRFDREARGSRRSARSPGRRPARAPPGAGGVRRLEHRGAR